ncbi:MAG: RNA polymerase sigma factor [Mangrovibacterium sp.]
MNTINFNSALLELQEKLYHYALGLTADDETAQDLLQETFLKALTYREKFKENTNFKAWIYTIMKNSFINNYRRNVKVRSTFDKTNNDYHMGITKDDVFASPESRYNAQEINENINNLADEYRVPFTMFLDGYKYQEISDELHLPLGTVKSRIFFTRKKLEKSLADYAY